MRVLNTGIQHIVLAAVLQLGLCLLLSVALYKTDEALQEVSLASQEDTLASSILSRVYFCLTELVLYAYHKDERHFHAFERLSSESNINAQLSLLAGKLPRPRLDKLNELNANADLLIEELSRCASFYSHERTAFGQSYFRYKLSHLVLPHLAALRESIQAIRKQYDERINEKKAVQLKALLKQLVLTGLIGNIPLTLFLLYSFSRSITTPLETVQENFTLLAAEKTLLKPLDGCDELIQLDQTFHEMAASARESLARDRVIFESLQLGLVRCSSLWIVKDVNPWLLQALEFTKEQLSGCRIQALLPEFSIDSAFHRRMTRYWCTSAAGILVPMNVSVSQVETESGIEFLVSLIDARHSVEGEKLKHDFMILIGRTLQQPLTEISSCIEELRDNQYGSLSERGSKSAIMAHSSISRLISLTNDLLYTAAADSAALNLDLSAQLVVDILNRAIADIGDAALVKNIELGVRCELDDLTTVLVDERRLIQVLVNLLTNAIKFTDNGKRVELIARRDMQQLILEVLDQGRGIPPEKLDKVFDHFVQVNVDDAKIGSGLGLSITRMIVNAHGGSISVSSKINFGTCFTIRLPITQ